MTVVVSDTSPIRGLHRLGQIDLLGELFGTVLIPEAVAAELMSPGDDSDPIDAVRISFLRVERVPGSPLLDSLSEQLDPGEANALALAVERKASLVLIDERRGSAHAVLLGLRTTGLVGVLIDAKAAGLIPRVTPLLERLRKEFDFFLSDGFMEKARKQADE